MRASVGRASAHPGVGAVDVSAVDIGQRIVETIVVNLADQGVSLDVLADVLRTSPLRVTDLCAGDETWSREELVLACEYLELDLAEVLHVPAHEDDGSD